MVDDLVNAFTPFGSFRQCHKVGSRSLGDYRLRSQVVLFCEVIIVMFRAEKRVHSVVVRRTEQVLWFVVMGARIFVGVIVPCCFWLGTIGFVGLGGVLFSVVVGSCLYMIAVVCKDCDNLRRSGVFVVDVFSVSSAAGYYSAARPTTVATWTGHGMN